MQKKQAMHQIIIDFKSEKLMLINFVIDSWDDKTTLTTLPQIMSDKKNTYVSANPIDHNFYYPQLDKNFSF